jgi:hypothetical protein
VSAPIADLLDQLIDLYGRHGILANRSEVVLELQALRSIEWAPRMRASSLVYGWMMLIKMRPGGMKLVSRDEVVRGATYAELVIMAAAAEFPTDRMSIGEAGPNISPYSGDLDEVLEIWRFMRDELDKQVQPLREKAQAEGKVGFCHGLNPIISRLNDELRMLRAYEAATI